MTAHVLISGQLFDAPEQRTSKAGKPFVMATIRAKDGDSSQWWKVLAFSEAAQAELMRLTDGDALSVGAPGLAQREDLVGNGGQRELCPAVLLVSFDLERALKESQFREGRPSAERARLRRFDNV